MTPFYKFVLLPPGSGDEWYGYMVHDDIKDLDEKVYARGETAVKCAAALDRKLRKYIKENKP